MEFCSFSNGTERAVKTWKNLCKSCKGAKVIKGTKSVKLDIMPGMDNNETIKVYKSGGADPDGDHPGDLYVTIKVREDPVFRREGSDIHVDSVLSITQASLDAPEDLIMTSELLERLFLEIRTEDRCKANENKISTTVLPKLMA